MENKLELRDLRIGDLLNDLRWKEYSKRDLKLKKL